MEGTEVGKETGQRLVVGVLGVVASWIMGIFFLSHFLFYKFSVMLFIMFKLLSVCVYYINILTIIIEN